MRLLKDFLAHQDIITELCAIKARPPVIRDLLPEDQVPTSLIYTLYKLINSASPPQGQLPQEIRTFLSSPLRRLQATVIACAYEATDGTVEERARRYLTAHKAYLKTFAAGDILYDFNRTWFLLRQLKLRRVALGKCLHCGHQYLYDREDLADYDSCAICELVTPVHQAA